MLKIMLVDDEPWIRTSLKNKIDWSDSLQLCAEASDGYEALQLAFSLRPDIVITDVRMPGMTGIEMLKEMHLFLPDVQAIFISGYNEFEYVKSAIELSASGYVLKPIRKNELNETLSRCLEKIRKNDLLKRSTQTQTDLLLKMLEALYHQQSVSPERLNEVLTDLGFHTSYMYIMLVRFTAPDQDPESLSALLSRTAASIFSETTCTVFSVSQSIYGIFLTSSKKAKLLAGARSLIRQLSDRSGLDASVALGTEACSCKSLAGSFASAHGGLKLMHLYSSHEIILPGQDKEEGRTSLPREITSQILDSIYSRNTLDLSRALAKLKDFLAGSPTVTLSDVTHILHLLLGNILRVLCEQDENNLLADEGITLMQNLSAGSPQQEILESFCTYCQKAALAPGKATSVTATIEKARHYLDTHYAEEISLRKMAALYYLNASYFSVSFKNVTGKNFNEYLTELRIEKAKKLLSNSDRKVNQVAHAVGYEDCSYFGKTFRKLTGMTPAEYQRQALAAPDLADHRKESL